VGVIPASVVEGYPVLSATTGQSLFQARDDLFGAREGDENEETLEGI